MAGIVTLQHVAKRAGVSVSTVSDVLRNRKGKVKVSESTCSRIKQVVKELDYQPLAAARALVTGKTFNIGFIISTRITLGLANDYFSSLMSGAEMGCRERGYNCLVGVHDLTSIKNFATPSKVRSRKIDGIVICGYVEEHIIQTIIDWGIPFVLVGESTDFPRDGILSVAEDMTSTWTNIFKYVYDMGHRKIEVGGVCGGRAKGLLGTAIENFSKVRRDISIEVSPCATDPDQFEQAFAHGSKWLESQQRASVIVGHAHWCVGFISALVKAGVRCPDDVSIVSTTDSPLCKWYNPPITAYSTPLFENGKLVANHLIDFIEKKITQVEAFRRANNLWLQGQLVVRNSVVKIID